MGGWSGDTALSLSYRRAVANRTFPRLGKLRYRRCVVSHSIAGIDLFAPLQLPERIVTRLVRETRGLGDRAEELSAQLGALTDVWREVARVGADGLGRLDQIDRRLDALDSVLVNLGPALEAVPRIEALAGEGIELARRAVPTLERAVELSEPLLPVVQEATGKVDGLTASVDTASDKVDPLIDTVDRAIVTVGPLIETMREAIPVLERIAELAGPLEGTATRLGRLSDRLPGGPGRR